MSSEKSQKPSQPTSQAQHIYKVSITPNVVIVERYDWNTNTKAYEKAYTYVISYSTIRYNPKKELIIIRTSSGERFIFAPVRSLTTQF